jgi:hypothetical protein
MIALILSNFVTDWKVPCLASVPEVEADGVQQPDWRRSNRTGTTKDVKC